jgi:general secretion pathway protein A
MYEPFFGLDSSPFGLTPDPRFLFRSKGHHDILSSLLYGVTTSKGVMLLLGDVGTGKTTLCRALLRELPPEAESVLLLNPHLSETELVGAILDDLGVERRGTTRGELMTVLNAYLLTAGGEGKVVVIVADEAQQMSVETLEQLRILSTLEAPGRKLLQIILVGQPELAAKLARTELRQFDQRIAVRCQLTALSERETSRYIEHRLRAAGLGGSLPFTAGATARVYRSSRGVPRLINLICDRALTAAFAARRRDVDVATVSTAVRSLHGRPEARRWMKPTAVAAAALVMLTGLSAAALSIRRAGGWIPESARRLIAPVAARPVSPTPADASPLVVPAAPVAASPAAAVAASPASAAVDPNRRVLAQLIGVWTLQSPPSNVIAGWPTLPNGAVDIPSVAERYQLTATNLTGTTAADLRAIGLPALIHQRQTGLFLLRHIAGDTAILVDGMGGERREDLRTLESRLAEAGVWLLWRNLDELVTDGARSLTPALVLSVALRLHNLGHLAMPLPYSVYDPRFTRAIRAFQRSTGLAEDGIIGPRTTVALSRVVASAVAPSIGAAPAR